jgi:cell division protein FtsB
MKSDETTYFEIWKIEQDHSRTRWTVTTFFLSVSFAILGVSFQSQGNQASTILGISLPDVQRITGLFIFWFGYALFVLFNRYTSFLRTQLRNMEKKDLVSFKIQLAADEFMYSKIKSAFSAKWLLFYFGLLYTAIVILAAFAKP